MLIYLMLGVFRTVSNNWIATMNGYTADQPITQIFPTLMSMLLFAFASWMIPKMAASIASGTLGTGAADLVGIGAEIGKGAALGAADRRRGRGDRRRGCRRRRCAGRNGDGGSDGGSGSRHNRRFRCRRHGSGRDGCGGRSRAARSRFGRDWISRFSSGSARRILRKRPAATPDAPPAPNSAASTAQSLARQAEQHRCSARWQRPRSIGAIAN